MSFIERDLSRGESVIAEANMVGTVNHLITQQKCQLIEKDSCIGCPLFTRALKASDRFSLGDRSLFLKKFIEACSSRNMASDLKQRVA